MKESEVLRQITDYLTAKGILWFRMNSGAMFGSHKGKNWAVRFGTRGMADILAFVGSSFQTPNFQIPVWIEVKNEKGKMSEYQTFFKELVESRGHFYVLARSVDDVMALWAERCGAL